jgi:hypothetical protein
MATGVEIAGLVLGSLPLLISALEHYEDVLDPTIAFIKYRGELSHATRELLVYHTSFEQTIQLLLQPITNDEELNDMLENTDSPHWSDSAIDDAIRSKLGKAYNSFFRKTEDTQTIIKVLAGKLNIDGADKITCDGLEAIISAHPPAKQKGKFHKFEFRERVKFSMKRQRIRKNLDDLKKAIETLDMLYSKAEKLDEPYKTGSKSRFAFPIKIISDNAGRLYEVLSNTWCSTHPSHSAGLLLEQRLVRRRGLGAASTRRQPQNNQAGTPECFGISLLQTPSPTWLDVEFRVTGDQDIGLKRYDAMFEIHLERTKLTLRKFFSENRGY